MNIKQKNSSLDGEATITLSAKDHLSYPMGQPSDSKADYYRWGKLKGYEQDIARKKSKQLTKEALQIVYFGPGSELNEVESGDDLTSIIRDYENYVSKYSEKTSLFLAKQMFAMKLQTILFPDLLKRKDIFSYKDLDLTQKQLEGLKYITGVFVRNGNPNADLLAVNLFLLRDHISDVQMKQLASRAKKNAENWYGESVFCEGCSTKKQDGKQMALRKGVGELEDIVQAK